MNTTAGYIEELLEKINKLERRLDETRAEVKRLNLYLREDEIDSRAELAQPCKERDEARNINGFALNQDYYEKFQHLRADVELKEAELVQLRKVCDDLASEKCQCVLCMENDLVLHHYSTLTNVIKAKESNAPLQASGADDARKTK